ncbi:hypothetical protein BJ165DRAFT_1418712 [Panaeolus papilionaceus]|nr:hypothetical protein BJ165DRAFT_1418712 [Panaeolus papilionaceus]
MAVLTSESEERLSPNPSFSLLTTKLCIGLDDEIKTKTSRIEEGRTGSKTTASTVGIAWWSSPWMTVVEQDNQPPPWQIYQEAIRSEILERFFLKTQNFKHQCI